MADKKIETLMAKLGITEAEAIELAEYDNTVDHAKAKDVLAYDLTAEQAKIAKGYTKSVSKSKTPTVYKFDKKVERKANPTKAGIISEIAEFLQSNSQFAVEQVNISNKERVVDFTIDGVSYSFTLTAHRKPKN